LAIREFAALRPTAASPTESVALPSLMHRVNMASNPRRTCSSKRLRAQNRRPPLRDNRPDPPRRRVCPAHLYAGGFKARNSRPAGPAPSDGLRANSARRPKARMPVGAKLQTRRASPFRALRCPPVTRDDRVLPKTLQICDSLFPADHSRVCCCIDILHASRLAVKKNSGRLSAILHVRAE
jgi:hypothetical protein